MSTYYARRSRKPSRRELRDRELVGKIHEARAGYRRAYGVRKTWKELRRRGVWVGRDRVGRLMRREGLEGVRRGKRKRTVPGGVEPWRAAFGDRRALRVMRTALPHQ